jgi:hypothetical protein
MIGGVGFLLIAFFGFVFQGSRALVFGPQLVLKTPQDGSLITSPLLHIAGNTQHANKLLLNGGAIFTTPAGDFNEQLVLSPGLTTLTLVAIDKYGKTKTKRTHVFLEQTSDNVAIVESPPLEPEKENASITNNS